jgi:hypothetical protein
VSHGKTNENIQVHVPWYTNEHHEDSMPILKRNLCHEKQNLHSELQIRTTTLSAKGPSASLYSHAKYVSYLQESETALVGLLLSVTHKVRFKNREGVRVDPTANELMQTRLS